MSNDRPHSRRRGITLALFAALAATAVLSGCDMFKPVGEGEYKFNKDGPADYFREGFEKNDGESSTEHFISRIGYDEHHLPSVSRTWASEGSWSMRIPYKGEISFTFSPKETGRVSLKYASATARTFNIWTMSYSGQNTNTEYVTTEANFKTGSVSIVVYPGKTTVTLSQFDGTIYIDELTFTPALIGSSPTEGSVFTEPPELDWDDTENGAPYRLQVSDREDFADSVIDVSGIQESRYDIASLPSGKCYYWRVLTANAESAGEWSSPLYFLFAGPASDDSFETGLHGADAHNAWHVAGRNIPAIVSSDASMGSNSLKLLQTNTVTEDVTAEMAVTLDSPKVLRYSYKVESPNAGVSAPTYLQFYLYTLSNGYWSTGSDYPMSHTGGAWAQAVELIPAGTHRIRWCYRRTVSNYNTGSFALIDDLRFEDPQPLAADNFENLDATGRTSQAWGYQGWYASSLSQTGGIGGSRGLQLSAGGVMMNLGTTNSSALTLVADTGAEPVILSLKTNGNMNNIRTSEYFLPSLPGIYRNSGWGQRFYSIKSTGAQQLQFLNLYTDQPVIVDDLKLIPYEKLTNAGLSENFESGSLGGQYYSDEYLPPSLDTANPHSGSYCLKVAKNAGKTSSFISFPISTDKAVSVSLWLRAEGTAVSGDLVNLYRGPYSSTYINQIPSTWTNYTFKLPKIYDSAFPLSLIFSYITDTGMTLYVDDITLTPAD